MAYQTEAVLRRQLADRRQKLESAITVSGSSTDLVRLLGEVDSALARIDAGTYGICEVCHDSIEAERLLADPLVRFCIDHLTPAEQRSLEQDLDLAARIQTGLLPPRTGTAAGWEFAYHYEPAGQVSGDYCDLIEGADGALHFFVGDVSGKGVAASMLMAHLHAMFRTLVSVGLDLETLVARASRLFCESTLPTHYATLVCGRASPSGDVEIANAGHLPALWVHAGGTLEPIESTGLPLGLFCDERFVSRRFRLGAGDLLLVYTDGLVEARAADGGEYDSGRLHRMASLGGSAASVVRALAADLDTFRSGARRWDDVTVLAMGRPRP